MQKLIQGVRRFQQEDFKAQQELFESLAAGQQPQTLFITCSDSRVCPHTLTQTQPGELFVLRVAGNLVPCYGTLPSGEAATIEYAVAVLNVQDIVVCGHSRCGAMDALIRGQNLDGVPAVKTYLQHAESTRRLVLERHADVHDPGNRLQRAIEENVLVQLDHLRTHPSVASALSRDQLQLHGWVYEFETGEVRCFDRKRRQFVPIEALDGGSVSEQPRHRYLPV